MHQELETPAFRLNSAKPDAVLSPLRGRTTIKVTLPALVPEMSYSTLNINNGVRLVQSSHTWHKADIRAMKWRALEENYSLTAAKIPCRWSNYINSLAKLDQRTLNIVDG